MQQNRVAQAGSPPLATLWWYFAPPLRLWKGIPMKDQQLRNLLPIGLRRRLLLLMAQVLQVEVGGVACLAFVAGSHRLGLRLHPLLIVPAILTCNRLRKGLRMPIPIVVLRPFNSKSAAGLLDSLILPVLPLFGSVVMLADRNLRGSQLRGPAAMELFALALVSPLAFIAAMQSMGSSSIGVLVAVCVVLSFGVLVFRFLVRVQSTDAIEEHIESIASLTTGEVQISSLFDRRSRTLKVEAEVWRSVVLRFLDTSALFVFMLDPLSKSCPGLQWELSAAIKIPNRAVAVFIVDRGQLDTRKLVEKWPLLAHQRCTLVPISWKPGGALSILDHRRRQVAQALWSIVEREALEKN